MSLDCIFWVVLSREYQGLVVDRSLIQSLYQIFKVFLFSEVHYDSENDTGPKP